MTMPKGKITIEKLAVMINAGFEEQRKHFDKRFDALEARVAKVEAAIGRLERGVESLEDAVAEIREELQLKATKRRVALIGERVTALERKVAVRTRG